MRTNLDLLQLDEVASSAKAIREWIGNHSHPEKYADVKDLELVRDFVHTLDLLETVLTRFEISVHLSNSFLICRLIRLRFSLIPTELIIEVGLCWAVK